MFGLGSATGCDVWIIAHRIAHHAQALGLPAGGDASHVLCEKQPFAPGGHKTRGLKLIRGSRAGDMSADALCSAAEEMIRAARPMGGIRPGEAVDDQFMEQLDSVLCRTTPMDATPTLPQTQSEQEDPNKGSHLF